MAVQGNLTLNTKVYTPRGRQPNGPIMQWGLIDTGFGSGFTTVEESVVGPDAKGAYRAKWKLVVPKLATADSACACTGGELGRTTVNIEVVSNSAFTTADLTDIGLRVKDLVATAPFQVSVNTHEPSW